MNVLYLANIRYPTEKAHGLQIAKMCEAFAINGVDVTLCVSDRETLKEDPFTYYSVERNFEVAKLSSFDFVEYGPIGFILYTFSFYLSFLKSSFRKSADIIYVRDPYLAYFLSFSNTPYVWEIHQYFGGYKTRRALKNAESIVFISNGLREYYKKHKLEHKSSIVAPDGVDEDQFDVRESQEESRERFNLPVNARLVLYTGHLYPWKGVDTLAQASQYLEDTIVVLVGGTDDDIVSFRRKYEEVPNILLLGRYPYKDMKYIANAADVLVIPNSAKERISREFTSPLKLFNYMASGKPIVASGLPSVREIVSEKEVFFAEADNPESFAQKIKHVLSNTSEAERRGKQAKEKAREYTWSQRARVILENI